MPRPKIIYTGIVGNTRKIFSPAFHKCMNWIFRNATIQPPNPPTNKIFHSQPFDCFPCICNYFIQGRKFIHIQFCIPVNKILVDNFQSERFSESGFFIKTAMIFSSPVVCICRNSIYAEWFFSSFKKSPENIQFFIGINFFCMYNAQIGISCSCSVRDQESGNAQIYLQLQPNNQKRVPVWFPWTNRHSDFA